LVELISEVGVWSCTTWKTARAIECILFFPSMVSVFKFMLLAPSWIKSLIETLHAFGICASYTEVKQFLTSAAHHEIAKTEVSCIPYGISPKTLCILSPCH
jgi:hypothetical protein